METDIAPVAQETWYSIIEMGEWLLGGDNDVELGSRTTLQISAFFMLICITIEPFNQIAEVGMDGATLVFRDPLPDPTQPLDEIQVMFNAPWHAWICPHISEMLRRLGIQGVEQGNMVEDTYLAAVEIINNPLNMGRELVALYVSVRRTRVHFVEERVWAEWTRVDASTGRELEEATGTRGMIPTATSAVDIKLKNVMIGKKKLQEENKDDDESSCRICLEDLCEGSIASEMPFSHAFHPDCIKEWLKQSHYCPLCRFEFIRSGASSVL